MDIRRGKIGRRKGTAIWKVVGLERTQEVPGLSGKQRSRYLRVRSDNRSEANLFA